MLENINLEQALDKESYKKRKDELSERLYYVQQAAWEQGVPVIIVFEGWDAAGKGTIIQALTDPIDPRGYKIYPIRAMRTYEKRRPWLWRFWLKTPARGEWAIFDRSWYGRVLVERMAELVNKEEWEHAYRDIVDFERTLADDGTLILKFFLHIDKKEQGKRFKKLLKDPLNAWRVSKEDKRNHKNYKKWLGVYEEMLERTDSEWASWTIVEATDKRHTRVKVYETVINALEQRLGITAESHSAAQETTTAPDATPPVEVQVAAQEEGLAEASAAPSAPPEAPATDANAGPSGADLQAVEAQPGAQEDDVASVPDVVSEDGAENS